jgi:beta-ureidopropionase / N-carbamoyl-L-amino-acid hydrolase
MAARGRAKGLLMSESLGANEKNLRPLRVNGKRLRADLDSLARIGRAPSGGINRTAFSKADADSRQWYRDRCVAAGLDLSLDGLGNMFAQRADAGSDLAAVWTGSHIDTVPDGGPLDGALGTVAALECVRRLAETGIELPRPIRSVVFADEEGNYSHLLGSYGLAHGYDDTALAEMRGRDGDRLVDALDGWQWRQGEPTSTRADPASIHAFVELHIEQGPHLEKAGTPIGVVTSIVGLGGGRMEFHGQADHAGTTPMNLRRDALRAAGAFVVALPQVAASVSRDAVITCGLLHLEPGGSNIVPRLAALTLDYRDPDRERLDQLTEAIHVAADRAAVEHDVEAKWHPEVSIDPMPMNAGIRDVIKKAATRCELECTDIASGAGHDSQNIATLAPTGMIFVPSHDGRSHSPAEHTDFVYLEQGANTLLQTLVQLAES